MGRSQWKKKLAADFSVMRRVERAKFERNPISKLRPFCCCFRFNGSAWGEGRRSSASALGVFQDLGALGSKDSLPKGLARASWTLKYEGGKLV